MAVGAKESFLNTMGGVGLQGFMDVLDSIMAIVCYVISRTASLPFLFMTIFSERERVWALNVPTVLTDSFSRSVVIVFVV